MLPGNARLHKWRKNVYKKELTMVFISLKGIELLVDLELLFLVLFLMKLWRSLANFYKNLPKNMKMFD
jgi:hypothetical protein